MSQENVEVLRSYWEVVGRLLDEYWANPDVPLSQWPAVEQGFDLIDPDAEWTPFGQLPAHGREQWLRAVDDALEAVDYWRPEIEEMIDAGEDRVQNVEIVRLGFDALQRGDLALVEQFTQPDAVMVQPPEVPDEKRMRAVAQSAMPWRTGPPNGRTSTGNSSTSSMRAKT